MVIGELIEKSQEFQKRIQEIREEANKARSEAAEGNKNAAKEKTVVPQVEARLNKPERVSAAKAELLEVSRPAVERAETIKRKSPALAEKVAAGEMSATAALKEIKKAEQAEDALTVYTSHATDVSITCYVFSLYYRKYFDFSALTMIWLVILLNYECQAQKDSSRRFRLSYP